jgi:hypothetical protein
MHDHAVTLGAQCASAKAEPVADLAKSADELKKADDLKKVDDLQKALGEAITTIADLKKDVAMLKAQPMPSRIRLRAVGKGEDLAAEEQAAKVDPVKDGHGEVHKAASLIKGIHQTGGEPLFKF